MNSNNKGSFKEPPTTSNKAIKEAQIKSNNIDRDIDFPKIPFNDIDTSPQINKTVTGKRTVTTSTQKIITKQTPDGTFTDSFESKANHSVIKSGDQQVRISVNNTTQTQKIVNGSPDSDGELSGTKTTQTTSSKAIHFESKDGSESHSTIHEEQTQQIFSRQNDIERDYDININIGNPTELEIEWRTNNITPFALIIHPNRLLPTQKKQNAHEYRNYKDFWREKYKKTWRDITSFIKKKIVGEETYEQIEKTVKEGSDNFNSAWETTQNPWVVKVRSVIDRMNLQTEPSRALEICQNEFGESFWVEDFIPEFAEHFLPIIINAYFNDDIDTINKYCIGEAKLFCTKMIEHRMNNNIQFPEGYLYFNHDSDVTIEDIKLSKEKLPQIIISAYIQTIDCVYERNTGKIIEGHDSYIAGNYFVLTLEPNLDPEYISIAPHGLPWQVRTLQTQKQKQLV